VDAVSVFLEIELWVYRRSAWVAARAQNAIARSKKQEAQKATGDQKRVRQLF
jgi:hypothetical protein